MDEYFARICWNSHHWTSPSGDAPKLERGTYAAKHGFGHEEWLFNFIWMFHGYHYAFLEPVNSSSQKGSGNVISVLLWAIDPNGHHVQVGEIKNCELVTDALSKEAFDHCRREGWLKFMERDVKKVGGDKTGLDWDGLFNIRFRLQDAVQYDDPLPIAKPTDTISRLKRYNLVTTTASSESRRWKERARGGSTTLPVPQKYGRAGGLGGTVDPYHPMLQASLMKLLQERFGKNYVVRERDGVDITVIIGHAKRILIEIKTDPVPKRSIRDALGQILEYAYFPPKPISAEIQLVIVAQGALDAKAGAYMENLRSRFGIPITYCQFSPGDSLPSIFRELNH